MSARALAALSLLTVVSLTAACGSTSASSGPPAPGSPNSGVPARNDAAALADLKASPKWNEPSCRWLEHGGFVQGSPQEEAIYRAAGQMGFIDLVETGTRWHLNRADAPTFSVTLTDRGKAETATCSPTSKPGSWGVPVAKRRYISGKFVAQEPYGRVVYEVDMEWVPTPVGDQVSHVLTRHMTVQSGRYQFKVYMKEGYELGSKTKGWIIDAMDDRKTYTQR